MSALRSVRVRAGSVISSSPVGTACLRELMSRCIRNFPRARVLGAVGLDQALVDAPGGLDRGVALIGEQWVSRRWARASVSRSAPVSSVRRAR